MLPYEPTLYRLRFNPRYYPRVVEDQKSHFKSDELFRRLCHESEVRYTGYRDRPIKDRQVLFRNGCNEGHAEIAFVQTGTNFQLVFNPKAKSSYTDCCQFEEDKIHIKSTFILNGVCVRWRGWLDFTKLDGRGLLEYDEERGLVEDELRRRQLAEYSQNLRELEDRHCAAELVAAGLRARQRSPSSGSDFDASKPRRCTEQMTAFREVDSKLMRADKRHIVPETETKGRRDFSLSYREDNKETLSLVKKRSVDIHSSEIPPVKKSRLSPVTDGSPSS